MTQGIVYSDRYVYYLDSRDGFKGVCPNASNCMN